jgi:hypothetical protein
MFDEKMSSGMALLDVAKIIDSKWIERLLYKLVNLDFPNVPAENHIVISVCGHSKRFFT